jgi:hypothetical protein
MPLDGIPIHGLRLASTFTWMQVRSLKRHSRRLLDQRMPLPGSPAAMAADPQPMAMSQATETADTDIPRPDAPASSADDVADATPMSQLPDAVDTEEIGQGLGLIPTAGSAAQELVDIDVDADDGFHLEDFQVGTEP